MDKKDTVSTNNTEGRQFPSASKLKSTYESFLREASALFPKVDQKFLMDVLKFETAYRDWEGSVSKEGMVISKISKSCDSRGR
jgi:hypothetical protein